MPMKGKSAWPGRCARRVKIRGRIIVFSWLTWPGSRFLTAVCDQLTFDEAAAIVLVLDYIERWHNPRQRLRLDQQQQGKKLLTQLSVKMG